MRRLFLAAAVLVSAGLIGCNQSERGGKTSDDTPKASTFNIKGPMTSTTIKQGDKQTVKLKLNRGKDFKEAVTLKAEAPTGISVSLDPEKVKPSEGEEVAATVSVGKDAALGEHTIKVTAKPETGNATDLEFKIKVEKPTE